MVNYCKDCENCIPEKNASNNEMKISLATCKKFFPTGSFSETLVTGQTPTKHQYCSVVRGAILNNAEECPDFAQKTTKEVKISEKVTNRPSLIDRFRSLLCKGN